LRFIVGLAVTQLLVQLVFFLHLGRESKPRLNLVIFCSLAAGDRHFGHWLAVDMHNLNYHTTSQDMNHRLLEQYKEGGI